MKKERICPKCKGIGGKVAPNNQIRHASENYRGVAYICDFCSGKGKFIFNLDITEMIESGRQGR